MDATPFLVYFIENIYNKLSTAVPEQSTDTFKQALDNGKITEKEQKLWYFVLSAYGNAEFSTKQLEKDYGDAAYATIRGFVFKFEKMGLLASQKYSNRVKYRVSDSSVQNARAWQNMQNEKAAWMRENPMFMRFFSRFKVMIEINHFSLFFYD